MGLREVGGARRVLPASGAANKGDDAQGLEGPHRERNRSCCPRPRLVGGGLRAAAVHRIPAMGAPVLGAPHRRVRRFHGPPTDSAVGSNPWIAVSRPYSTSTYAIVAKSRAGLRGSGDLAGNAWRSPPVGRPSYYLLERGLEHGLYRRQEAVFQAVVDGEAPAALLSLPIARWLARGNSNFGWFLSWNLLWMWRWQWPPVRRTVN
jgi:hypothetical protein